MAKAAMKSMEGKPMAKFQTRTSNGSTRRSHHGRMALIRLMAGASTGAAALAIVLAPAPLRAQAVNGTPTVLFGSDAASRSAGTDVFNVTANEAVVNWATSDANVFLPQGNTLRFQRDASIPYTVLNRVDTAVQGTGALAINGTVSADSYGKIWFYNPGGWVVGSTGVFNVGALLLTSNPITYDQNAADGQKLYGASGEIRLGQVSDAASSITIQGGATINASGSGSYVALVAPRVTQGGTVNADGPVAYVGAEAATLKVNNGLFDITVDTGTTDSAGVVHTGTTTGTAGTVQRGIYMVAVPKNNLLTMLVGGTVGYAAADTAQSQVDGTIVLGAGYNVSGGAIDSTAAGVPGGSIRLESLAASNSVTAVASDTVTAAATTSVIGLARDATIKAGKSVVVNASGANRAIVVGGNLSITSSSGATGGTVAITAANGGSVAVVGNLDVSTDADGGVLRDPGNSSALLAGSQGADATAGAISVSVNAGSLGVGGASNLHANATSGIGALSAGIATGGSVAFTQQGAGSNVQLGIATGSGLTLTSNAISGLASAPQSPVAGSASTAGAVSLTIADGTFATNAIDINSQAQATFGSDGLARAATAGALTARFTAITPTLTGLSMNNQAFSANDGAATAGNVSLYLDAAQLSPTSVSLSSDVRGTSTTPNTLLIDLSNGSAISTANTISASASAASGGAGIERSGSVTLALDNATINAGNVFLSTDARGSDSAPDATAGNVTAAIGNGSTLTTSQDVSLSSSASGGSGTNGGIARGGTVSLTLGNGSLSAGGIALDSTGRGGARDNATGQAGAGYGGNATLTVNASGAVLNADLVTIDSAGSYNPQISARLPSSSYFPGSFARPQAGVGIAGTGGTSTFAISAGTVTTDEVALSSIGIGGSAYNVAGLGPATGGAATGGTAQLTVSGGALVAPRISLDVTAYGGEGAYYDSDNGIAAGAGGAGTGGTAAVSLIGGSISADVIDLIAGGNIPIESEGLVYFGAGGSTDHEGSVAGAGGAGTGGNASITIDGGSLLDYDGDLVSQPADLAVSVTAQGVGGLGGATFSYGSGAPLTRGAGGTGTGGAATFAFNSGVMDAPRVTVRADGTGGLGGREQGYANDIDSIAGRGGDGQGGSALLTIGTDLSDLNSNDASYVFSVSADGFGQAGQLGLIGGTGGAGIGGTAGIDVTGGTVTLVGPGISASGEAGSGGESSLDNDGGLGGIAQGGNARLTASGPFTALTVQDYALYAYADGGSGGDGGSGYYEFDGAGAGGMGGAGTGGTVRVAADSGALLTLVPAVSGSTIDAGGYGAQGGLGGNAAAYGFDTVGNGGSGGSGTGGTLNFEVTGGATLDLGAASFSVDGFGSGGSSVIEVESNLGRGPSNGGAGGDGIGGAINFSASGTDSLLKASSLFATATGYAGNGADGQGQNRSSGAGASGGAGGSATGGSILLHADGGGAIDFNADQGISLYAQGFAGNGGRGTSAIFTNGAAGGNGGDGGTGTGGTITVEAYSLGAIALAGTGTTTLAVSGDAGNGGRGGNGAANSTIGGNGGNGGNGGFSQYGHGGNIGLEAVGGTLTFGNLSLEARGRGVFDAFGGAGGAGGPGQAATQESAAIPAGQAGSFGSGSLFTPTGGQVRLHTSFDEGGSFGSIQAGTTQIDVTSILDFPSDESSEQGQAGLVDLSHNANSEAGLMRFGALAIDASGQSSFDPAVSIAGFGAPIEVDQNLTINSAGSIAVTGGDQGGVRVNGIADLHSDNNIAIEGIGGNALSAANVTLDSFGETTVTATGCITAPCTVVHADDTLSSRSLGNFTLAGPAFVEGLSSLTVQTSSSVLGGAGSGYASDSNVSITAIGDVEVRNARGGSIYVDAGAVVDGATYWVPARLTLGEIAGAGSFTGTSTVRFRSGGTIDVTDGTSIATTRDISFQSVDDIVIGSAATIRANFPSASSEGDSIGILAGSLFSGSQPEVPPVARIKIGQGTLVDALVGTLTLSAQAIDTRGSTLAGRNVYVDVFGPPALGAAQSNDGGNLVAGCLEGDICVGSVVADNRAEIGNGEETPLHVRATGAISGDVVRIASQGDLTLGDPGAGIAVIADQGVTLISTAGNVDIRGATSLTASNVLVRAGGSLTGDGRLVATAGDVGLTVGGDIAASAISATGQLTGFNQVGSPAEARFVTPGSFRVGQLSIGSAAITAGGDIAIDTVTAGGSAIDLVAAGNARLGAASDATSIAISGNTVDTGILRTSQGITLAATNGVTSAGLDAGTDVSVSGASLGLSSVRAGRNVRLSGGEANVLPLSADGNIAVDLTGSFRFTSSSAGGTTTIAAGSVNGGPIASGGAMSITSPGAVVLGSASTGSGSSLSITADRLTVPSLQAGGNLTLNLVADATLGTATAGGNIVIDPVTLSFTSLTAPGSISLVGGTITGDTVDAGTDLSITSALGQSFSTLAAGRNATLTASGGPIAVSSDFKVGGSATVSGTAVALNVKGALALALARATAGDLAITAGGRITVNGLATGTTINFASSDLDIGANGALGESTRTTAITLRNTGTTGAALGDGLSTSAGYALSNAEFGRIHSGGNVTFDAGSSLQIGALNGAAATTTTGNADGQIGGTGTLRLVTGGLATVSGDVVLGNAAGNTLAIDAVGGVFVDATTGSLRLVEGSGRGGTLSITGKGLGAITRAALNDIANLADEAAINSRLSLNDGVTDGRTVIEAGTVAIAVSSQFLVQNTAQQTGFDARRGLVADTLTVRSTGTQPLAIAINGVVGGQTGLAAIPLVAISGSATAGSTVNGCVIANVASCSVTPADPHLNEVRDVIREPLSVPVETNTVPVLDSFTASTLVQINQITPPGFEPLIDEPVTGTGNEDLLGGDEVCAPGETDCARP